MENNKHPIDKFLKEQMDQLPVEFNEAHWADAARRLDEEEKRRKPFLLLFFGILLLIGLGTTAYKNWGTTSNTKNAQATAQASLSAQQLAPTENDQTGADPVPSENILGTKQPDLLTNKVGASAKGAQQSLSLQPASATNSTPAKDFKKKDRKRWLRSPNQLAGHSDPSKTNPNKKTNLIAGIDEEENMAASPQNIKQLGTKSQPEDRAHTKAKKSPNQTLQPKPGLAKISLNADDQNQEPQGAMDEPDVRTDATAKSMAPNTPPQKKLRIYKSLEDYQALNPRYVNGLENYTYVRDIIPLGKRASDSIRALLAQQTKASESSKPASSPLRQPQVFEQQPSSFFMLAGLAAARGYRGADGTAAAYGLSPSLGFGYQLNFSERMSLYLSAFMNYINHLNITETATHISYSFDRDSTLISVTRKNLLQLQVPIDLAYRLTPKHTVYGGFGINLGLNTVSLYEDSKQGGSQRQFGYTSGLRFMDVNTTFGYEYNVRPSLSLGIFYQQGFFDMTKNDYFNNRNNDKNSRGGVRLRYKFRK